MKTVIFVHNRVDTSMFEVEDWLDVRNHSNNFLKAMSL